MRSLRRESLVPLGLAAASLVLAVLQRPGLASSDTKIDLHVDPARFLGDVASTWTPTGDLGHVQGGQYGGYLFPMGPFFALGHAVGLPAWLVQRLWLGALLALAAWGTVRLLDALLGRPRGAAHVVAGLLVVLNPYTVTFANRTSVTLLGYAALPWLLLAVHRGVRAPRGWTWPAAFALLVTATGGGVNAAVTAFVLLGPLLLLVYEVAVVRVAWADARRFAWRAAGVTAVASLWWVAPVLVQARFGIDFLQFTEQPGTIWGTTSLTESLRLMGYWVSYIGVGYGGRLEPYFTDAPALLFHPAIVVGSLLVPALALAGFWWARRWRYGPFFLLLALGSLLLMTAGFPEGTPLRRGLNFTYNRVDAVQFLRTTYKAGPLLAIALACLGGAAAGEAWRRVGALVSAAPAAGRRGGGYRLPLIRWKGDIRGESVPRPDAPARAPRLVLVLAAAALLVASAWPLVRGRAVDRQLMWDRIPAAWEDAARDLDRDLPRNTRAIVLPGQLFAFYRWGGTVDPILPALTERPVAVRHIVPYADLHAVDLLWTVDSLVTQGRVLPGQLDPLLRLLGAGAVITGTDDRRGRSGARHPFAAWWALASQGQDGIRLREYGPVDRFPPPAGDLRIERKTLPQVRRFDVERPRGIVRVAPAAGPTIVDGSAESLAALAAFGALPSSGPLAYAGDRASAEVARAASVPGAEVVIGDSNRRRVFVASRLRQNTGPTLAPDDPISVDAAVLNPFPDRGAAAQTVAALEGIGSIRAPSSPGFSQFPEHRPYAAVDGDPETSWLADRSLDPPRRRIEIAFTRPRDVPWVDLLPHVDERGVVTAVEVEGRRFPVRPGWNRLRVDLEDVERLVVRIAGVRFPPDLSGGAGGISELRVPGLRVRERLRPPVLAERALAGTDLSGTGLTYLLARATGDDPFRRSPLRGAPQAGLVRDRGDAERGLARVVHPPASRHWVADAWVTVAPDAPDHELDRLQGTARPGVRFSSSGRYEGRPSLRASSAFLGLRGPGWIGPWERGRGAWLEWRGPRSTRVVRLRLHRPLPLDGNPAGMQVRRPTRVRLRWPGGATPPLPVAADGTVVLPRPVRARRFRLEVLAARFARGTPGSVRQRRAVGIGWIEAPGLPRPRRVRPGSRSRARCGEVVVRMGGRALPLRPVGSLEDLGGVRPVRARPCGAPVRLSAGRQEVDVAPGTFRPYLVRLRSPAPTGPRATIGRAGTAAAPTGRAGTAGAAGWTAYAPLGRVLDPGDAGRGRHDGIRLDLAGPSWLILGESYNRGWRAECDGRELGAPRVVDGFANGWLVPGSCRAARMWFAPNRPVTWAYVVSLLACLGQAGVLLAGWRRRRAAARVAHARAVPTTAAADAAPLAPPLGAPPPDDRPAPWPLRRAAAAGLAAGVVLGFLFAIRAGVVIAPAVALVLWRGVPTRALLGGAALLLAVVVPALYLLVAADDRGGYNTEYAVDLIAAHWVGVAAWVLLALALARSLAGTRRLSTASPPSDAPGPAPRAARPPPARA